MVPRRVTLQYESIITSNEVPGVIIDIVNAEHESESHGFQGYIQQYTLANPRKTLLFLCSYRDDFDSHLSFIKVSKKYILTLSTEHFKK